MCLLTYPIFIFNSLIEYNEMRRKACFLQRLLIDNNFTNPHPGMAESF